MARTLREIFLRSTNICIAMVLLCSFAAAQKGRKSLSAEDHYRRGLQKSSRDNCEGAVIDFGKAIQIKADDARFFKARGDCYAKLVEPEKALDDLNKALELKPDYAEAYVSRARKYTGFRDEQGYLVEEYRPSSKADLDKAIKIDPMRSRSYLASARYFLSPGVFGVAEGLADLAKSIELDPSNVEAYIVRVDFYKSYGEYEKAIGDATTLIKKKPRSISGYEQRAGMYYELGNFEQAIRDYTAVLKLDPSDHFALVERSAAYFAVGKIAESEADQRRLQGSLKTSKEDPPTFTVVANSSPFKRPKPPTDAEFADSYVELSKKHIELVSNDAEENNFQIKRLTKILQADPQSASAFFQRGRIYARLKQDDNAIADYSQAIKLNPNDPLSFNNRGVACARTGNFERAIMDFARALNIDPKQHSTLFNFGLALFNQGSFGPAVSLFGTYLKNQPNEPKAYRLRAMAYRKLGKVAEAESDEKTAEKLQPG